MTVEYPRDFDLGPDMVITALSVCLNNRGDRVKGLAVKGLHLRSNGDLESPGEGWWLRDERTNCGSITSPNPMFAEGEFGPNDERWQPWSECLPGHVAVALELHHETGDTPRSVSGISVLCREVEAPKPLDRRRGN